MTDELPLPSARIAEILRHLPVGLYVYHLEDPADDRTLRFLGSNPAAERITRVPTSALIGRTLDECFPNLRERGVPQAYADVVRTGVPWRDEQLLYSDARVATAAYAVHAFALPGRCVGVAFEDATGRARAQEELRRSEARQRALVDAIPDTLYSVGADGVPVDVRRGEAGPDALTRRLAVVAAAPPEPGEVRVLEYGEEGREHEVRVVRTPGGELLAIVRDITERKADERRKDEFISIVSHELRTPLTSIRGALGLIEGGVVGAAPEGVRDLVTVARSNADRLIRLINDMLDLDKMEAGGFELDPAPIDANELVDTALEGLRGAAAAGGVRLRRVSEAHAVVTADRDRLLQVLTNLLSNALRYSPPQAAVTVTLRAVGSRLRFLVQDEGPGIPPDRVDLLFRKFAQVGGADARRRGGTGLGLAISKAIVEQHGGSIGLLPGGPGACFYFDLPLTSLAAAPLSPDEASGLFSDLRTAYAASLPGQVEAFEALLDELPRAPHRLAEAVSVAHRLHGTAGSYGMGPVSDAAARIERALREPPGRERDAEIAAGRRDLRRIVPA